MAVKTPDVAEADPQDRAEVFDETHLTDELADLTDDDLDDEDSHGDAPTSRGRRRAHPDDVATEMDPHQDELLDEGVEETFPASDPVSVKHIT